MFFTGLACIGIALAVLFQNKKLPLNQVFSLFGITFGFWSLLHYLQLITTPSNTQQIILANRISSALIPFLGIFWIHFIFILLNKNKQNRTKIIAGYSLCLILSMLSLTTAPTDKYLKEIANIRNCPITSPVFYYNAAFISIIICVGLFFLIKERAKSNKEKRRQIKWALLGVLLAFGLGMVTYIISFETKIFPYGLFLTWLCVPLTAHAIIRRGIIDLLPAINKSALFIAAVGLTFIFHGLFIAIFKPMLGLWFSTALSISIIIFSLFFTPLKPKLIKLANHYVYKGRYDYHEMIRESTAKLVSSLELDAFLSYLLSTIQNSMNIDKVCLLLKENIEFQEAKLGQPSAYKVGAYRGLNIENLNKLSVSGGIMKYISLHRKSVVKEKLEHELPQNQITKMFKVIEVLSPQVAIPLFCADELIGALILGDKPKKDLYSSNEIAFLEFLAVQAATSLENDRLYKEAITDGLTQLYHHRYFKMRLDQEMERSKRHGYPLSLIMVDLDFFKNFNDTYGHLKGDLALKGLSRLLKHNFRTTDIISRYGGEEFTIILPNTSNIDATIMAKKIGQKVSDAILGPSQVTVSIGVIGYDGKMTRQELIKKTDSAMYNAKKNGRNRVETE